MISENGKEAIIQCMKRRGYDKQADEFAGGDSNIVFNVMGRNVVVYFQKLWDTDDFEAKVNWSAFGAVNFEEARQFSIRLGNAIGLAKELSDLVSSYKSGR